MDPDRILKSAREEHRLHVVLEELLHRVAVRERKLADARRPRLDANVVAIVDAFELITTRVAAPARRDGERNAKELRVVDRIVHERPRLREVERLLVLGGSARDVEVRLRRAVAAARRAAALGQDRLDLALERVVLRRLHRRERVGEACGQHVAARARTFLRWRRRLEAVLRRAVFEPALQREVRVGARLEDRTADVLHLDVEEARRRRRHARHVAVLELQLVRTDRFDQEQRIRIRAERREHVATFLQILVARDVEVSRGEVERITGVRAVTTGRVADALLLEDRKDVAFEVSPARRRVTARARA
jgi:hypothetical protein